MKRRIVILVAAFGLAVWGAGTSNSDDGPGTYFVPDEGTANVAVKSEARLVAVKKTVAFLGGSITEMDGFRPRVMNLLRAKYPEVDFKEIASGLSSTCSDAGAFRLAEDVLSKGAPDLFIVEAAVNDDQDGHFSEQRCIRGMEGCVRQVLLRHPKCAVVIGLMVNRSQYQSLTNGVTPLQYRAHSRVAAHYGAALADVGSALATETAKGGMTWAAYGDCHPSPAGCDLGAKVVMEAVGRVFDPTKPMQEKPLPEPLDSLSYFHAQTIPVEKLQLGAGWQVSVPDWKGIPGSKRGYFTCRPAIWSEVAGSELAFAFSGTAVGAFLTAGPDAGNLEVSVDGGGFRLIELQANYGALHYPYVHLVSDDLADGPHMVKLRVKAVQRDGRTCSAVRIHRLYVNGTILGHKVLEGELTGKIVAGNSRAGNSIWRSVCPNIAPGKVKVCMDWDDSCFTDFRLAELCRKYKAKVTFNITPREHTDHCVMQRETTERNGTTYHFKSPENFDRAEAVSIPYLTNKDFRYCYEGFKIAAHLNMRYEDTPEDLAFSRKLMEEFLSIAPRVTGQDGFGIVWSRGGKSPGIIKMAKELGFRYCRGPNTYENPGRWGEWAIQPTTYWSEPPEKFWEWYELAKRRGDVFWFWGHTQDLGYDDAIWARLEEIIKRISEDPDAEWIDVGDLAKENKEGAEQRTMCNPLPIEDYPLGVHCRGLANGTVPVREVETWLTPDGKTQQFRELADPALLCVGKSWYLYPSAEMCYRSDDGGASWKHIPLHMSGSDGDADLVAYAPTIVAHRGEYLLAGSNGFVFRSKSPEGPFVRLGHLDLPGGMVDGERIPFFWDPCFFSDDDGRLYLYWGCTPTNGIWGCELDASNPLKVVSAPKKLIAFEPDTQPWEIAPNKKPLAAYLEGAWMVKHDGKYILTYSAAGTENKEYAMGQVVGTSPLGSFVKPKDNPFLRKTTGLITGTSHGAVAKGPDGGYWVVYTIRASTVHWFERRIGMDRISFNTDGSIAAMSPSEVPQFAAGAGVGDLGWERLSGKVPSDAVSVVDDDLSTFWTSSKFPDELVVDFGETKEVRAFRLIWRDGGLDTERGVKRGPFRYRVEAQDAEGSWRTLVDASANSRDLLVDYRETPTIKTRSVRLTVLRGLNGIVPQVVDFALFGPR